MIGWENTPTSESDRWRASPSRAGGPAPFMLVPIFISVIMRWGIEGCFLAEKTLPYSPK